MKNMLRAVAFAVPFVFAAGLASADEPMQLTDNQLDGVTAGATAIADALAQAFGPNNALAQTETATQVGVIIENGFAPIVVQLSQAIPTASVSAAVSLAAAN